MTVIKVLSNHYIVRPNKWPSGIALDFQSIYEMVMCSSPAMGDNFHTCIFSVYCFLFSVLLFISSSSHYVNMSMK